jgi:mRNA interferase MazF
LLLGKLPSQFDDWLICMISSQLRHFVEGFDEIIKPDETDFGKSGLKVDSVIRIGRLAVVDGETLLGAIGEIDSERLFRIKTRLAKWLIESDK